MDIKKIRALANLMQSTGLNVIEIKEGDGTIRLERHEPLPKAELQNTLPPQLQIYPAIPEIKDETKAADFNDMTEVKSPIVGVFYAAPSPESQPFVQVGSKVKKGDVLCIVEAMKLMNEIVAEADGEIYDICVKDGEIVEFGQTLFKML